MVITEIRVKDENGVEHLVEGKGWLRVRSQNYNLTKGEQPPQVADREIHVEAHITLTTPEERGQLSDKLISS